MVRNWNIVKRYYAEISKDYSVEDLRNMRNAVQSEVFWNSFRGLDKIFNPEILLEIMLCFERSREEVCEGIQQTDASQIFEAVMRNMRKYNKPSDSPQGRKLEEQLAGQLDDFVRIMPYEMALAAMEIQKEYKAFFSKHRNESIKAYGNSVVPQVVYQIFKAIQQYDTHR